MASNDQVLVRAEFDRRLPTYFMLQAQAALFFGLVSIPLMPLWFLLGRRVHRRQYENLACELTTRSLNVRRGFLLRIQQNIPLDKITDLALYEGPILRYLGLCSLRIETAGGGQTSTMGQAMLPGVVGAEGFRDRVLVQRDAVVLDGAGTSMALREAGQATPSGTPAQTLGSEAVLVEIRDTLGRIEQRLGERAR